MTKIFVIIDGMGDRPIKKFGGKTPLEAANTPNLDFFAKYGQTGLVQTVKKGIAPESDTAFWALLGNNPERGYAGRGALEAYGTGMKFNKRDLTLRANFATLKGKKIIDRRVGRSLTTAEAKDLARAINKIKLSHPFEFKATVGHRGILVIHGNFSDKITNLDPAYKKIGSLATALERPSFTFVKCKPLVKSAKTAADVVNEFEQKARVVLNNHKINIKRKKENKLQANIILLRDAGDKVPKKTKKFKGWSAIVGYPLEIALTSIQGMKVITFPLAKKKAKDGYISLYKGLRSTIKTAKRELKRGRSPNYFIHFKETDLPGHDGRPDDKKKMLEVLDKEFFSFLRNKDIELVVTADHSTPCELRTHSSDTVPLLYYGEQVDEVERFGESYCKKGSLGTILGKNLMKKLRYT